MKKLSLLILSLASICTVKAQTIKTIAGNGVYSGSLYLNGVAATTTEIAPGGVTTDAAGNIYVSDLLYCTIRKIDASGIITTIAGTHGTCGTSGENVAATAAQLNQPGPITIDASGNIYFCEIGAGNNRVRKINSSGIIKTFAGTGAFGSSGDNGPATAAKFNNPTGIAVDAAGNVYIADNGNNEIRKVNTSGTISVYAGTSTAGFPGNGVPATASNLEALAELCFDGAGNLYCTAGNAIAKINSAGTISVVAGGGTGSYGDGYPATVQVVYTATGITADMYGNIFFTESDHNNIKKINSAGNMYTLCGSSTGTIGYSGDGGSIDSATFNTPGSITMNGANTLLVNDCVNRRVRQISYVDAGVNSNTNVAENFLQISPNPASGYFNLISGFAMHQIDLYSIEGKKVLHADANGSKSFPVSLEGLPKGFYMLRVNDQQPHKLVVE